MSAEGPIHLADLLDRVALDREAAHDDDAAAVLDLLEYLPQRLIERRMTRHGAVDLAHAGPYLLDLRQDVFERRDLAGRQVDRDLLLGELVATPRHRRGQQLLVQWCHGVPPMGSLFTRRSK